LIWRPACGRRRPTGIGILGFAWLSLKAGDLSHCRNHNAGRGNCCDRLRLCDETVAVAIGRRAILTAAHALLGTEAGPAEAATLCKLPLQTVPRPARCGLRRIILRGEAKGAGQGIGSMRRGLTWTAFSGRSNGARSPDCAYKLVSPSNARGRRIEACLDLGREVGVRFPSAMRADAH